MPNDELVEIDIETMGSVIDRVFRAVGLENEHKAIPVGHFIRAARNAGVTEHPQNVRLALRAADGIYKVQLAGRDGSPVHCWARAEVRPTEYVPRLPEVVRLPSGKRRKVHPDQAYRIDGRAQWGSQIIREARRDEA